jgi:hypothetical protein
VGLWGMGYGGTSDKFSGLLVVFYLNKSFKPHPE